jgi:hypothetical protein
MIVLTQLQALKPDLGISFNKRVKFALLCFTHELTRSVIRYEHYDTYGVGERDFDSCFEMGDAISVCQQIVKQLGSSAKMVIDREMGQGTYSKWLDMFPQKCLF